MVARFGSLFQKGIGDTTIRGLGISPDCANGEKVCLQLVGSTRFRAPWIEKESEKRGLKKALAWWIPFPTLACRVAAFLRHTGLGTLGEADRFSRCRGLMGSNLRHIKIKPTPSSMPANNAQGLLGAWRARNRIAGRVTTRSRDGIEPSAR